MNLKKYILVIFGLCLPFMVLAQDSITIDAIQPFSYDFNINNGELTGAGAQVLNEAISAAHVTMLGNTLNSKLDAELSRALLGILNLMDYKKIVLEEGLFSGKLLSSIGKSIAPKKSTEELNHKYSFRKNEYIRTPIQILKSSEGVEFVQEVAEKDWTIFAVGLEDWASYGMLVDELYSNIPKADRDKSKKLYEETKEVLDLAYRDFGELNDEGVLGFMNALYRTGAINSYLAEMENFELNKEMVFHFKKSLEYWKAYGNKRFFKKNVLSIEEAKERLASQLKRDGFDFSKDKIFAKMFIGHLAKGITGNGFYGVGSMLHEMAEFYEKRSLTIGLIPRFYEKGEGIEDYVDSDLYYLQIFKEFIPLGKRDEWVLIDLRTFNEKFLYGPYYTTAEFGKVVARYDMLIIPKTDGDLSSK